MSWKVDTAVLPHPMMLYPTMSPYVKVTQLGYSESVLLRFC